MKKGTSDTPRLKIGGNMGPTKARLKYVAYADVNPAAGGIGVYSFRANGLYDPDYTGTGHQPLGFDQYMALYSHYCVLGSKIKVTFAPFSAGTYLEVVGISVNNDQSLTGNFTAICEQPGTKYTAFQGIGAATVPYLPVVTHKFDASEFFGVKDPNSVREICGTVTTNPAEGAYFNVFVQAADLSSDVPWTGLLVELEFDVLFSEREEIVQS